MLSLRNRKLILFLALSLGLHILVALFLFFKKSEPEIPKQTIEFEVLPEKTVVAQKGQERRMGPRGKTGGTKPGEHKAAEATPEDILRDGGKVNLDKAGTSVAGETIFGEGSTGTKGSGAWVEQIGIEKGIELSAFLQRIQERIDRGLDYPEDMAVQRIRGDVRVDLYVDRKGRIQGDFHMIRGPETLLNLYVTSALLILLKEPLPENLWAKEDKIPITIHVKFSTYEFAETKMQNDSFFQANELNFVRSRYVQPLAVAKVEKFFTRYVPPIIPLPGGFYVDLIMLAQYIQNIDTPDPDDKRKERLELRREHMEIATKKKRL